MGLRLLQPGQALTGLERLEEIRTQVMVLPRCFHLGVSTHLSSFVLRHSLTAPPKARIMSLSYYRHSSNQMFEDYFLYEVCRLIAKATPVHPLFCCGKHSRKSMYKTAWRSPTQWLGMQCDQRHFQRAHRAQWPCMGGFAGWIRQTNRNLSIFCLDPFQ